MSDEELEREFRLSRSFIHSFPSLPPQTPSSKDPRGAPTRQAQHSTPPPIDTNQRRGGAKALPNETANSSRAATHQ